MYKPQEIFEESIKIFMKKLEQLKKDIDQAVHQATAGAKTT